MGEGKDIKQVIVIRRDLKMRRGKEVAQGAHASMAFLMDFLSTETNAHAFFNEAEKSWLSRGHKKICVRVNSKDELYEIHSHALAKGLKSFLIEDSGKTEFQGQVTPTCCAIGPDHSEKINSITGHLELM